MPSHPLVVHFPIALWITSLLFDLMAWGRRDPAYARAAFWLVGVGLIGAAVSINLGWVDLLAYERGGGADPKLSRQHLVHSLVGYAATLVYLGNFAWRWRTENRMAAALLALSVVGALLIAVTGYLGGVLRASM